MSPPNKQDRDRTSNVLDIAVRVYPVFAGAETPPRANKWWPLPKQILVFDTETRTDTSQRLTFGSYRSIIDGRCVEEGLFYGDDLTAREHATLKRYVQTHEAETYYRRDRELRLLSLREFLDILWLDGYKARCLMVAFNHPFDLSRIASAATSARGRYAGGFSLTLWTYRHKQGDWRRNQHRPEVRIKHIDSKRALIGFTARKAPDSEDLIPIDSRTGKPKKGYKFQGHFLDLRTLAFALTDRGQSLESACEAFEVEHGKTKAGKHGQITPKYIDYNRHDVLATCELTFALLEEYKRHRVSLQATKAFSPASIGKGYLRDMGITPVLQRQPDFPRKYLGFAQSAFYGGRTSAHIRKVPVPVVYTDFLSMYPTVNALMGLWKFVIADKIRIRRQIKNEVSAFLQLVQNSPDILFDPKTWRKLPAFVRLIPNEDLLPSRSKYSSETNDWQVALNYISSDSATGEALWYSLPDVVASVLLTHRVPRIVDAFGLEPKGKLASVMKLIRLRDKIRVNPRKQDFFKVVIEQRKLLSANRSIHESERKRLDKALKVLANATSYGIYAEMIRQESDKKERVICHGFDPEPYSTEVSHPEVPGEYCFPPLASLITGAARLMLALLEHSVIELGGTYAMEDTDSMAIVATPQGGLVSCEGGAQKLKDGKAATKVLTWKQIHRISDKFLTLNPYDRKAISGSILKIEDDNFDPISKKQRQLYCLAISAKRYALFLKDQKGHPILLGHGKNNKEDRWSEHGLGHLLNPADPENDDRDWISKAWLNIIRKSLGFATQKLKFKESPAINRISVSSPTLMEPFVNFNEHKQYAQQIKPFNFLISCQVKPFGHPLKVDPQHFHLIAPYNKNPRKWLKTDWIDRHSKKRFRITRRGFHGNRYTARVKTYGEILEDYEFHPEAKCADSKGTACTKQTIGLLKRRHIRIGQIKFIGKESNLMENVESGLEHSDEHVYTEYANREREWKSRVLPALKAVPLNRLIEKCYPQLKRRALINLRNGSSRLPHPSNQSFLASVLEKIGCL